VTAVQNGTAVQDGTAEPNGTAEATLGERLARLPWWAKAGLAVFAALVVVELTGDLIAPLGAGGASGSTSSSYSTGGHGLAAYAELLSRSGHRVERASQSLDKLALSPDETLVAADTALDADEVQAVQQFVQAGGRVVLSGPLLARVATVLVAPDVRISASPTGDARPLAPVPEVQGVSAVSSDDNGSWRSTGPALPVLGRAGAVLAAVATIGEGRVVLLADTAPLQNDNLAEADNAAFGLAAVGPSSRPVLFAESSHGGTGTGLAAIPRRWKWALIAGGVATLLAMWSAGRRFGPPQDEARDLPPPRRAYVDAVAATLAKTRQPDASLAPLRAAAREQARQRAGLPPDADEAQVRAAATSLGLAPDEVAAVFGPTTDDEQAMALGRAMARLGGI
jgi:hypothetical protein